MLGSLGNPLGTILGGLIYGVAIMFMQSYFSSWADILPYVLLIAVMLFKPEGSGWKGGAKCLRDISRA